MDFHYVVIFLYANTFKIYTLVNKIEVMYGGSHINVKVEQKLWNCGNQP